ncbi:MAG: BON domain-containing protein [Rhodanobacteraceae bacterium]
MKSRLTVAIASLVIAAAGTAAYAQAPQQTPPATQPPMASAPMTANTPATGSSSAGMASTGNGMSNSKIDHKIKQALTADGVTATHVKVSFSDGTATLTGSVFSHADIAKAKKAAMGVHGVTQVDTSGLHSKKG